MAYVLLCIETMTEGFLRLVRSTCGASSNASILALSLLSLLALSSFQHLGAGFETTINQPAQAEWNPSFLADESPAAPSSAPLRVGSKQLAGTFSLGKLARVLEKLSHVDEASSTIRRAANFNQLPRNVREAVIRDWRGTRLYAALQPSIHEDVYSAVLRMPDEALALAEYGLTRHGLINSSLSEVLEKLASLDRLAALSDANSVERRLVRLHAMVQGTGDYRDRFISRARLQKLAQDSNTKKLTNLRLFDELDVKSAVDAAMHFAAEGTSRQWVENQVQLLREQAKHQSELRYRWQSDELRDHASKAVGMWLPDRNRPAHFDGAWPWRQVHLSYELNQRTPFRLAYAPEDMPRVLRKWREIPFDETPRAELRELVDPALRLLENNVALQLEELKRLQAAWADAPLLSPDDLATRIHALQGLQARAHELLEKPELSKVEYLRFVDRYLNDLAATTVVRHKERTPRTLFGPGGEASSTGTMPLPSQGVGYWSFEQAYAWMSDLVDTKRAKIKRPVVPIEVGLSGRAYDGRFDDVLLFAAHDLVHERSVRRGMRATKTIVEKVEMVEQVERQLQALPASAHDLRAALGSWLRESRARIAEAIWENGFSRSVELPDVPTGNR